MNGRTVLEFQWEEWRLDAEDYREETVIHEEHMYGGGRPSDEDDETQTEEVTMNDERDTEISE